MSPWFESKHSFLDGLKLGLNYYVLSHLLATLQSQSKLDKLNSAPCTAYATKLKVHF